MFAGLYLHRLWQLGLEKEYYQEGVRPHLAVFYESIRARPAFVKITGWREQAGERSVRTQEDDLVQNARWGLGAAAVLGKFCTLCWLKHRPSVFFHSQNCVRLLLGGYEPTHICYSCRSIRFDLFFLQFMAVIQLHFTFI